MNIYELTEAKFNDYFASIGESKYRTTQILEWLYRQKITSLDEITNMKKELLEKLKADFEFTTLKLLKQEESSDGTVKFLFELEDKEVIETVLMTHNYGYSVCVSTQVGCNMGCKFCASGLIKKRRDLKVSELVLQVLTVGRLKNIRISHVVLMGIGEPFDNYANVIDFISLLNYKKGLEIGSRHITLSTSGIVPKIKDFTNLNTQVNLAISLHAPNNEIRDRIMPVNKRYDIKTLVDAIKEYTEKTNRRATIEYILIKDLNDTKECALELVKLLKGINVNINLIPYNEVSENEFKRSERTKEFYKVLKDNKMNATLRREQGHDINAACGQLRNKAIQNES